MFTGHLRGILRIEWRRRRRGCLWRGVLACWPFEVWLQKVAEPRIRGENEIMITPKFLARVTALVVLTAASGLLLWAQQKSITVEGYVLDSACAFTKNLEKPISRVSYTDRPG